ncbi:hypothetical protein EXU48_09370 [Occultella glacieicola]|uniref:DUF4352 domain-containing protein n=1 Tax=Occultella glacieicola TaxID=2518684 RepID=A0ABY2E4N4_9MICO|nr:hypothetical protein [Occultella glacieicola]TDE94976.1 hypothetical protein EXU48_09370 [Occultella glacieicola]
MSNTAPDRGFAPPYPTITAPTAPAPHWTYAQHPYPPSGFPPPAPPARHRALSWLVPCLVGVVALVIGFTAGALVGPFAGPMSGAYGSGNDTSREQPAALGTSVTLVNDPGEWEVSLGEPDYGADARVLEHDDLNEPAPDGLSYVVVPVTVTYHGPDRANAGADLWVSFVGADGRSYDEASLYASDAYVEGPDSLFYYGDLYDGGSLTGNVTLAIPEGAEADAASVWRVESIWTADAAYFAAG